MLRPRIDPRVERTRDAVLEAATVLLRSEGPGAVTHARVAEAAGVGRATVYRHWPGQGDLLRAALDRKADDISLPDPELPVQLRLAVILEQLRARLNDQDMAAQFAALIGRAEWDPALRDALAQMCGRRTSLIDHVLRDGIARGELPDDTDVEVLRDGLVGALVTRRFLLGKRPDRQYLARVIAAGLRYPQRI
jgi:AcrR family transcriptional regulator